MTAELRPEAAAVASYDQSHPNPWADLANWQAAATDAVFSDLPDTLIAPSDGPAPVLALDYLGGYEANDY